MTQSGIPQSHVDLLTKKGLAHLVTLLPDGKPQSTPVWVDYDGKHVLINTAVGRLKDKTIQRDPRVAFSVTDPENLVHAFDSEMDTLVRLSAAV